MRNTVAKRIRKEVGTYNAIQTNTSDKLMYKELKKEHTKNPFGEPKFKENKRHTRRGFVSTPLQVKAFKKLLSKKIKKPTL